MAGHTGQTLNDRLNAARYALAGQGLARVVCKATTEEVIGPKKKHLDYLLQCTHEPNVSIPQLANLLIERTNHSSWVVVFKALVTVHHLMCYGNERFTQYLASSNCTFQLSNFLDKNGVKGYEMSTFIRRYAKYLNEKALSYRTVAFDFTKIKRGKEDGSLRSMNTDKLLKTIPTLQSQVDSLLEFDCTANDLTNGVINAAFMLLFRDLIRLFACYNDGIINCLEKYFDMNKKHAREALDIYKKFLIRMDRVAEFLKVAENVGIDKGEIPDLTKAPSSLLDALEQHLSQLEGKKGQIPAKSGVTTNGTTTSNGSIPGDNLSNNNSNSAGSTKEDPSVKKALEEEELMLNKLKEKHMQEQDKKPNNPFLSMSPTNTESKPLPSSTEKNHNQGILDLFNDSGNTNSTPNTNSAQSGKASDDLLCLSNANPFADILNAASVTSTSSPLQAAFPPAMAQQNMVPVLQNAPPVAPTFNNGIATHKEFASDAGFAAAFGTVPNTTSSLGEDADAIDKRDQIDTLPVPAHEEPIVYSASPSPTHDVLKGAGTTPILANAPDLNFGDDSGIDDNNISRGNSPLPPNIAAPPPSGENSPFGAPFEPTNSDLKYVGSAAFSAKLAPARPPPPPHELNSNICPTRPPPPSNTAINCDADGNEFMHSSIEDTHAPPPARPPAPASASQFASFDVNQQQMVYQQQQQQPQVIAKQSPAQKKSFAFQDLDIAMRQTFAKPNQPIVMPSQQTSPPQLQQQQQGVVYLPPGYVVMPAYGVPAQGTGFDAFGDVLQPQQLQQLSNKTGQTNQITANNTTPSPNNTNNSLSNQSLFKGDLDSSLASLAQNLDINGPKGVFKKGGQQQWSSPKNNVKTGAAPQSGWSANQQPLSWNTGAMPGMAAAPQIMPSAGQWSSSGVSPIMVSTNSMPMMQQTYGVQMRPAMVPGMAGAVPVLPGAVPVMPTATTARPINTALNSSSDPFGALLN